MKDILFHLPNELLEGLESFVLVLAHKQRCFDVVEIR